jgi:hypothetical protein
MEDDVLCAEHCDKSDEGDDMYDDMMTHEQIQQMFSEESDCDGFWCFESILADNLLVLGRLIRRFDSRGV